MFLLLVEWKRWLLLKKASISVRSIFHISQLKAEGEKMREKKEKNENEKDINFLKFFLPLINHKSQILKLKFSFLLNPKSY